MQRTFVFVFSAIAFFHAHISHAERIVLKNPSLTALLDRKDLNEIHRFNLDKNFYVVLDSGESLQGMDLRVYKKTFEAEDAFFDLPVELIPPNDGEAHWAKKAWHVEKLKYDQLPKKYAGQGIVVAVLDTGVNYKHPALAQQMWINENEIPKNDIDDDKNGYIDDVYGFDFMDVDDEDPFDPLGGHGTHCAGLIAGLKDQASQAQGIAPGAKIMAVRVLGGEAENFMSDVVQGIKYAVKNNAKIISSSWRIYKTWSGYYSESGKALLKEAVQMAEKKNVIFVAAAGNEEEDNDLLTEGNTNEVIPAGLTDLSNMIVVAASGKNDKPASFTNFGKQSVTLAAPGANIISTYGENGWSSLSGTSMATPIVAGLLARALSAGMAPQEAIRHLKETAQHSKHWDEKVSTGLIDPILFLKN